MPNTGKFEKGNTPWNKGIVGSLKTNRTSFAKGSTPWNKGMKGTYSLIHDSQFKKGQAPFNKGKVHLPKENHPNWVADRSNLVKSDKKHLDGRYREWMFSVKTRDAWKCKIANQECKGRLESHHILSWKEYPELRYELNNGITLCHAHHPRQRAQEKLLAPKFKGLIAFS